MLLSETEDTAARPGRLGEGALLVGTVVHPDLDVADGLASIDELANACVGADAASLALELFGSGRLRGNPGDYYDPENSVLPSVIERGLGIPITLSVLFIEVGRLRGLAVDGVGMPGHFLTSADGRFYDPFHGGIELDRSGCEQLYWRLAGRQVALPPQALEPVSTNAILSRMLWNLRSIAEGRGDDAMQHRVLELLSAFDDAPLQVRLSWATSLAGRGQFGAAAAVAEAAMVSAPESAQERLRTLAERWSARLN